MKGIVFSDNGDLLSQSLTFFRDNMDIDALVYFDQIDSFLEYGAKTVYRLTGEAFSDNIANALIELISKDNYDYVILCSTATGREVGGIISEKMNKSVVAEIFDFKPSDNKVVTKRYGFGGKTVLEEESDSIMFTVLPGISDASKVSEKSQVKEIPLGNSLISLVKAIPKETTSVNLEKAGVIVAIGRGIGKKEGIDQIDPLVKAVKGELAGSRPVCLDYQWLSEDRQVGLSGKKVKPKLYIALGISGQIQHIAGMRGSKVVLAINKDKSAPIFEEADYGIVGDIFQVVPKIVSLLQS